MILKKSKQKYEIRHFERPSRITLREILIPIITRDMGNKDAFRGNQTEALQLVDWLGSRELVVI